MHSQNTLKEERVKTFKDINGIKYTAFIDSDAKLILKDILEKEVLDSLITEYMLKDKNQTVVINTQSSIINELKIKVSDSNKYIDNLNSISTNKNSEIEKLNLDLTSARKEVRKQRFLKKIAFSLVVLIPVGLIVLAN